MGGEYKSQKLRAVVPNLVHLTAINRLIQYTLDHLVAGVLRNICEVKSSALDHFIRYKKLRRVYTIYIDWLSSSSSCDDNFSIKSHLNFQSLLRHNY